MKTWQLRELLSDARKAYEVQENGGDEPFMNENVSVEALGGLICYLRQLVESVLVGEPSDRILVGNLYRSLALTGWSASQPPTLGEPAPGFAWVFVWSEHEWKQVFVYEGWS